MAEVIDDYPAPVTSATKEWMNTFNPPKNAGIRSRLIAHFAIDPDLPGSAPQRFISTLFAKFLRDRG